MEKQIHYLEVQLRNKNNDLLHLQDEIYKLSKNDDNNSSRIRRRNSSTSSISSVSSSTRSKSVTLPTTFRSKKVTKTPNYIEPKDIMSSENVINEFVKKKIDKKNKNDDNDDDDINIKLKRIHDQLNPDPYYNYYQKMNQSFPFPPYPPYPPPPPYGPSFPPYVCKNCEEKSRIQADLKSIFCYVI